MPASPTQRARELAVLPPDIDVESIVPGMPVVSLANARVGLVDHVEDGGIKLQRALDGTHHYIPVRWITWVDGSVHLDRPRSQVMRDWSTTPYASGVGR